MATTVYHHVFLMVLLMLRCFTLSGGQNCDSNINVDNIERRGDLRTEFGRQAIVPNSVFTCSGRITRIRASSSQHSNNDQDPYYQLWRPSSTNPNVYTRVGSVRLTNSHASRQSGYWIIDISFSGNDRIEFQAGDVIGHFDPGPDPRFRLWSISTTGYTTYSNSALDQADMFDISSAEYTVANQQPLIQITYDIRCDTILSNGAMLCSPGMGYQGDTCSFSCNTGYDLTGSTTRTCQSNGQWSGSETICTRVHCTSLPTPVNGIIDCPLGDDNVLSYEDSCRFTCNIGYVLTGSNTRVCQGDGSWSGTDAICTRVSCPVLPNPDNGMANCQIGDDNVLSYEDTCDFTCNAGYNFVGSNIRTCQGDGSWNGTETFCRRVCLAPPNGQVDCGSGVVNIGLEGENCTISCHPGYILQGGLSSGVCDDTGSWSGGELVCVPLNCSNRSTVLPEGVNIIETPSCGLSYQSQCTLSCDAGFTGNNVTYMCNVTSPNMVDWVPIGGADVMCVRVRCPRLINGVLQCPNEPTIGVFEETCTFSCNPGYVLQGSSNRTCLANQSWSEGNPVCLPLNCSTLLPVASGSLVESSCTTQYWSTCTVSCDTGFIGDDVTYLCNITNDSTLVDWVPIGRIDVMCERVHCPDFNNGNIRCPNGSAFGVFEDTCIFFCSPGYEIRGPNNGTCLADQNWSRGLPLCIPLNCTDIPMSIINFEGIRPPPMSCSLAYQSQCTVSCVEGYTGVDVTYVCNVTNDPYQVSWVPIGGLDVVCERVTCENLGALPNGSSNCSTTQMLQYQDICTFHCNDGYELQGSVIRQCEANGQWSGTSTQCNILHCPDITMLIANSRPCDTYYTSTCIVECEDEYITSGDPSQYQCGINGTELAWTFTGRGVTCCPGGTRCVECINVLQQADNALDQGELAIVPYLNFSCNGRITNIKVGVSRNINNNGGTFIHVWQPSSPGSVVYNKTSEVLLQVNSEVIQGNSNYETSITLTGDRRMKFQSGDVVGYHHTLDAHFIIQDIQTEGYTLYQFNEISGIRSVNLTEAIAMFDFRQPLIQITVDIRCNDLPTSIYEGLVLCSSGSPGVGYQGDTCSFTCNTGYELTGSPQRTCQSDGSWSGSPVSCTIMECPSSSLPMNSMLAESCSSTYQSMCDLKCEEGFNGSGDPSYVCNVSSTESVSWLSNGEMWRCERIPCESLTNPINGNVTCVSNTSRFEDTCAYYCDRGYQLYGNRQVTCKADGTWSSNPVTCTILQCDDPTLQIENSQVFSTCNMDYNSHCSLNCSSGYSASNISGNGEYVCDVNDEGSAVEWKSTGDALSCVGNSNEGDSSSQSSIPVIAGAAGGTVLFVIILVCVIVIFCVKRSQKRKSYPITSIYSNEHAHSDVSKTDSAGLNTFVVPNKLFSSMEAEYTMSSNFNGDMNKIYDYTSGYSSMEVGGKANHLNDSIEENKIYETTCIDTSDYGPIYIEPPTEVEKIYATFEGKRFQKLHHKEIKTLEHLGSGEFGVVTQGLLNTVYGDVEVAVKSLNTDANAKEKLQFLQEAAIMCQFNHQNVIKLHGIVTDTPAMIVLEYMSRGDLKNLLETLQPSDGESVHPKLQLLLVKFCHEIAAGMTYLNGKQFVHRDLAARNVLVSEECVCKIADFGMSRDLIDENYYITSGGKIPVKWTAPEALHYRKYSVQSDVWSYGCVLYEVWSLGRKPFEDLTNAEALEKVDSGYRLPPPPGCSRAIYKLTIKCWHPDPKLRPNFIQITKLLTAKNSYLLSWSDDDKQIGGEEAMKLGAPLECASSLYYDLQRAYRQT